MLLSRYELYQIDEIIQPPQGTKTCIANLFFSCKTGFSALCFYLRTNLQRNSAWGKYSQFLRPHLHYYPTPLSLPLVPPKQEGGQPPHAWIYFSEKIHYNQHNTILLGFLMDYNNISS